MVVLQSIPVEENHITEWRESFYVQVFLTNNIHLIKLTLYHNNMKFSNLIGQTQHRSDSSGCKANHRFYTDTLVLLCYHFVSIVKS